MSDSFHPDPLPPLADTSAGIGIPLADPGKRARATRRWSWRRRLTVVLDESKGSRLIGGRLHLRSARLLCLVVVFGVTVAGAVVLGGGTVLGAEADSAAVVAGANPRSGDFVCVDGDRLELGCGGTEWNPVGFNDYRLTSAPDGYVCDPATGEIDDDALDERLDSIAATGANVVRTWFFQSYTDGAASFDAFDRVLAAAAVRGLRVIPVLTNHFPDCEPSGGGPKDIDFYAGGFLQRTDGYALSFRDFASLMAARYRDDPTIALWQLVNEAQAPGADGACDEASAASALAGFTAEMTAAVRAADPNHPISLGPRGVGYCGTGGNDYALVQEAADVCGMHQYEGDGGLPSVPMSASSAGLSSDAVNAIEQCGPAGLNKPIIAGEIGVARDPLGLLGMGDAMQPPLTQRARLINSEVTGQASLGLDGVLIWQRVLGATADEYGVAPGDPIDGLVGRWSNNSSDSPSSSAFSDR